MKVVLGLGVEMFGFSVGVGGLSDGVAEVRLFLLLLDLGVGGLSGSF
jgi:hypothetical protein